jgi:hypothetical protein
MSRHNHGRIGYKANYLFLFRGVTSKDYNGQWQNKEALHGVEGWFYGVKCITSERSLP